MQCTVATNLLTVNLLPVVCTVSTRVFLIETRVFLIETRVFLIEYTKCVAVTYTLNVVVVFLPSIGPGINKKNPSSRSLALKLKFFEGLGWYHCCQCHLVM